MTHKSIAIIGAGMAGLSAASALAKAGREVVLFDKGRGPGGRMATRRMATPHGEASFDHGAQFFAATDPEFAAQVARWERQGHVAGWPSAGPDAWVGTPGMNAPLRAMASLLDVRWGSEINMLRYQDGWRLDGAAGIFDAVVVAIPAEQAARLLGGPAPDLAVRAVAAVSDPCWTVMAAFATPLALPDIPSVSEPLGWAARNSAKPGRSGPESWVLQATTNWSRVHLENTPDEAVAKLLASLPLTVPPPIAVAAHRWRYGFAGAAPTGPCWDAGRGIGLCGDWLAGRRIGDAWASGSVVAAAILNS